MGHPVDVLEDFDGLLSRAQLGSADAFTEIYADLAPVVHGYLRGRGVRDAEDVTSDVFISVFTAIQRFSGGQPQFRSWVMTIAHRRAVDVWRRAAHSPVEAPYEPLEDVRSSASAEGVALDNLGAESVAAVLARLSDDQRQVLVLRVVADLTVEQVAEVTGKTSGAVKALQRRGLATLRRILSGEAVPL
jgi:RNA polymerase sigma-70 factor (ECF subfamily)